jgi:hypothetical protein
MSGGNLVGDSLDTGKAPRDCAGYGYAEETAPDQRLPNGPPAVHRGTPTEQKIILDRSKPTVRQNINYNSQTKRTMKIMQFDSAFQMG